MSPFGQVQAGTFPVLVRSDFGWSVFSVVLFRFYESFPVWSDFGPRITLFINMFMKNPPLNW